jgi:hypothetical protein
MKRTFIHRSAVLGLRMDVHFEKGKVPDPSSCIVLYIDHSQHKAATKEFGQWIKHVRKELEKSGAKVKPDSMSKP